MSNLVRKSQRAMVYGQSTSGTAGKAMVVAGGGTLAVLGLAALLPFVGTLFVALVLLVFGVFLWE